MSEFIIIGAGLAGSSTAWHLTRQGHTVTLLERTTPANPWASSHGSARIFRYAYPQKLYASLVVESKKWFDELEAQSGEQLITPTGCVDFGEKRNPAVIADVLESVGVEFELLSAADARERFPQFAFDTEVLYHPGAGVLDAQHTVAAMVRLAQESGLAEVYNGWPVAKVERKGAGFVVTSTDGRTVEGGKIIISAGGWLPSLAENLSLPDAVVKSMPTFRVTQEQAFHFPYRSEADCGQDATRWPAYIHKGLDISVYSLPGGRDASWRGQKLAQHQGGKPLRTADIQDGGITDEMRSRLSGYVSQYLPGLKPEPYAEGTCLMTSVPTEDFILDTVDGVTLFSPCSGHGAKFGPLLGELAARSALGKGELPREFSLAHHAAAEA